MIESADALVILTGALVATTVVYAWYTRQMSSILKEQLRWSQSPALATSIEFRGPVVALIRFANVGQGAAREIKVWAHLNDEEAAIHWGFPSLLPGQDQGVILMDSNKRPLGYKGINNIEFHISCVDSTGRLVESRERLDLSSLKQAEASKKLITELRDDQLAKLEKIAESIGELAGNFSRFRSDWRNSRGLDDYPDPVDDSDPGIKGM